MTVGAAQRLGTWSLRLDAVYCAVLGIFVAAQARAVTGLVALPEPLVATIGVIVVLWAGLIVLMLAKLSLVLALRIVMSVNGVAAVAVALTTLAAESTAAGLLVASIALEILIFAVSQALALRWLGREQAAR